MAYTPYSDEYSQNYSTSMNAYLHYYGVELKDDVKYLGSKINLYSYFIYSYELNGKTCYQISVSDSAVQSDMYKPHS